MSSSQAHDKDTHILPEPRPIDDFKDDIEDLYMKKRLPLKEVQATLERVGLSASKKILKQRLELWGFRKYVPKEDLEAAILLISQHQDIGDEICKIQIGERIWNRTEFEALLKRRHLSSGESDRNAPEGEFAAPNHLELRSDIHLEIHRPQATGAAMALPQCVTESENDMAGVMPRPPPAIVSISYMAGQIHLPRDLQGSGHHDLGVTSPPDHHEALNDPISLDEYSASLLEVPVGDTDSRALMKAVIAQKMCQTQHPMLLVTINIIFVWLELHDGGPLFVSFMGALFEEIAQFWGTADPITLVLEWTAAAARKELPSSRIDLDALGRIARSFRESLGPEHPHTIVTLYYKCFHMIRVDKKLAEAEEELKRLYVIASKTLGRSNFQTICILATLSRAQSRQKKYHAALETINRAIQEAPLGLYHPHRLQLLKRKALIYWELKDQDPIERSHWGAKVEQLYFAICRGMVATLGKCHKSTKSAYESLIKILEENERGDAEKQRAQELLADPQVPAMGHECWWRCMVRRDREGDAESLYSEDSE